MLTCHHVPWSHQYTTTLLLSLCHFPVFPNCYLVFWGDPMLAQEDFELPKDGDRRLGLSEMRRFAELSGFEGTDAEWQEEFQMPLCCKVFSDDFQRMLLEKCYTSIYNHITCIQSNKQEIKIIGCRSHIHREKALQQQVLKLEAVSSHVSDQCCI